MKYLSVEDIAQIHSMVIDETGGKHGVRDKYAILSLVDLPKQKVFGKELYSTIFEKAAVYARNIILTHPFVDGNKRTSMASAAVFLEDNGYVLSTKKGEIEVFALNIISKKSDIKTIAGWFKKHSKKIKK